MSETLRLRWANARQRFARWYASIYFFPVVLIVAAVGLFLLSSALDASGLVTITTPTAPFLQSLIFAGTPGAARSILSSIATGWAQILGVVFSVTLVTVQLTASSYTPQVLSQFEKDKINQLVLGAYVGLVTYALLVLKTIRIGGDGVGLFGAVLGTNLAVIWAVIDLLLLVLYIGNLLTFIRPHRFVESIVSSAVGALETILAPRRRPWLEPAQQGDERLRPSARELRDGFPQRVVRATTDGVVARLDWENLLAAVRREMLRCQRMCPGTPGVPWRLRVERDTGDWVSKGDLLAVLQAPTAGGNLDLLAGWVQLAFDVQDERRPEEDTVYGLVLLSGMGAKAASGAAAQVTIEVLRGLFGMLTRIVKVPSPATFLLGEVDGVDLIIQRPPLDLFDAAVTGLAQVVDAALQAQLTAVIEEMGAQATALLLRLSRDEPVDVLRRLATALYPLYRQSFRTLEEPRSLQRLADQLIKLVQTLQEEGLNRQEQLFRAMLLRLVEAARQRPQASACLRRALAELELVEVEATWARTPAAAATLGPVRQG